ncbi:MAG: SIMPL domain-containing protein [Patescibacteria group bacterium]
MDEKFSFDQLASSKAFRMTAVAVLGFLALFLLVKTVDLLVYGVGRSDVYPAKTISVEGTGEARMIPDIAQITYSVTEQGATVSEAQDKATTKMDAALAAVEALGVEEKDVKTVGYNVYPRYEYQQSCYSGICPPVTSSPRIIGYEVSQSIELKVRDTSKAGEVLQALGTTGVQNISGPNFVVDDTDAVSAEARELAIVEAKEKAKRLAKDLGVSLGNVVSFSESSGYYPMYDSYYGKGAGMEEAMMSAPSLPVGEEETTITVYIVYEIR